MEQLQQVSALGVGGVLIVLVGFSIFRLIAAWSNLAATERESGEEHKIKAEVLQEKLNKEIAERVALEIEVKFLRQEIEHLKDELVALRKRIAVQEEDS